MHQRPRQVLRRLLRQYGRSLYSDPRRVEALLQDLCGQHPREIFVLVHAQEQHIPHDLLAAGPLSGDAAHWQRLSRRLQDRLALTPEAADWAVESWALALNIAPLGHLSRSPFPRLANLPGRLAHWGRVTIQSNAGDAPPRQVGDAQVGQDGRSFPGIGVQWRLWYQQLGKRRYWFIPVFLVLILLVAAQYAQQFSADGQGRAVGMDQREAVSVEGEQDRLLATLTASLERLYPLPRAVRIGSEAVPVHLEPRADSETVTFLEPPGAVVLVDAYSAGGEWVHVSTPAAGWIEQEAVSHTFVPPDGSTAYAVVITPGIGEITASALRVRQHPMLEAAILSQLDAGERVLFLAATPQEDWLQIIEPTEGWISSQYVVHIGSTSDLLQGRKE